MTENEIKQSLSQELDIVEKIVKICLRPEEIKKNLTKEEITKTIDLLKNSYDKVNNPEFFKSFEMQTVELMLLVKECQKTLRELI